MRVWGGHGARGDDDGGSGGERWQEAAAVDMRGPCESRISPTTLLSGFTSVQSRGGAQTEAEWEFQLALDTGAMTPLAQKLLLAPNRSRRALYDLPYHWMEQFVFLTPRITSPGVLCQMPHLQNSA